MKKLIILILFTSLTLASYSQINAKHWFGDITKNDVTAINALKTTNTAKLSFTYFLRLAVAETAFETPLFHTGGGQFFSATGVGVSVVAYDINAVKKFSLNLIPLVDNYTKKYSSVALTAGVPIPKLNLPDINAGIRYDWKAKIAYLQTSITVEF